MMIAKIQFGEDVFPSLLLGKSSILISPFVTFTSSSKRTLGDIFPTYLHLKRRIEAESGSILPFLLCVQYGLTRILREVRILGVPTCLKVLLTWFNAKTALKPQIPPEMKKTTKKSPSSRIKKKKRMRRLF